MATKTAQYPIYITDEHGRFYVDCNIINSKVEEITDLKKSIEECKAIIDMQAVFIKSAPSDPRVFLKDLKVGDHFTFANDAHVERRVYIKLKTTGRMSTENLIPENNCCYMAKNRYTVSYCSDNLQVFPK